MVSNKELPAQCHRVARAAAVPQACNKVDNLIARRVRCKRAMHVMMVTMTGARESAVRPLSMMNDWAQCSDHPVSIAQLDFTTAILHTFLRPRVTCEIWVKIKLTSQVKSSPVQSSQTRSNPIQTNQSNQRMPEGVHGSTRYQLLLLL